MPRKYGHWYRATCAVPSPPQYCKTLRPTKKANGDYPEVVAQGWRLVEFEHGGRAFVHETHLIPMDDGREYGVDTEREIAGV